MRHFWYRNRNVTLCGHAGDLTTIDITTLATKGFLGDVCPLCQSAYEREQYCKVGHVWPWPEFVDGQACQCGAFHLARRPDTGVIFVVTGDEFIEAHADEIADLHPHRVEPLGHTIEDLRAAKESLEQARKLLGDIVKPPEGETQ